MPTALFILRFPLHRLFQSILLRGLFALHPHHYLHPQLLPLSLDILFTLHSLPYVVLSHPWFPSLPLFPVPTLFTCHLLVVLMPHVFLPGKLLVTFCMLSLLHQHMNHSPQLKIVTLSLLLPLIAECGLTVVFCRFPRTHPDYVRNLPVLPLLLARCPLSFLSERTVTVLLFRIPRMHWFSDILHPHILHRIPTTTVKTHV